MSNTNYREIERKYRLPKDINFNSVERRIVDLYLREMLTPPGQILFAETIDDYWRVPGKGDFVRLRNSKGSRLNGDKATLKEITVKHKDKGTNLDRLEVNVEVERILDTRALLNVVLGRAVGRIRKYETVIFTPDGCVVSLCRINGEDTFVEVEGPTVASLKVHEEFLKVDYGAQEKRSLFEMYVDKGETNE